MPQVPLCRNESKQRMSFIVGSQDASSAQTPLGNSKVPEIEVTVDEGEGFPREPCFGMEGRRS